MGLDEWGEVWGDSTMHVVFSSFFLKAPPRKKLKE